MADCTSLSLIYARGPCGCCCWGCWWAEPPYGASSWLLPHACSPGMHTHPPQLQFPGTVSTDNEGPPVCSRWTCPPCLPSVRHETFQTCSGWRLKSQLCHLLALQPRASALASLTLGLLVYKEGRFITPVLSGSSETVHIAYLAQARDKSSPTHGEASGRTGHCRPRPFPTGRSVPGTRRTSLLEQRPGQPCDLGTTATPTVRTVGEGGIARGSKAKSRDARSH